MKLHTLAALLASTIAAAAVAAPSTATSTLPPGVKDMSPDQIDYNLQAKLNIFSVICSGRYCA